MALAKQVLQFFFGVTDKDAASKAMRAGDLVLAKNMQQLHAGKHIKRGAFVQATQNYDAPTSITAESLTSPDGVQALIRDAATDTSFARGADATHNISKGKADRVMVKWPVRFPALESGEQLCPMAKQAGNYYVWLADESHFMIAQRSNDGETLLQKVGPIAVQGSAGGGAPSTHVKSFAVVDAASFDSTALWVFWVDWTSGTANRNSIWAYKFPHSDLAHPVAYEVDTGADGNKCLTSIAAGVVEGGRLTVVAVGCEGKDGASPIAFRSTAVGRVDTIWVANQYQVIDGAPSMILGQSGAIASQGSRNWTGSGVSLLSVKDVASYSADTFAFTFWGVSDTTADTAALWLWQLRNSDLATVSIKKLDAFDHGSYACTSQVQMNFIGSTTGYETETGAVVVAQCRLYYTNSTGAFLDPDNIDYPDKLFVRAYSWAYTGDVVAQLWEKRGAWLAHGWFQTENGINAIVTGWQDPDGIQMPYHLRRMDTGAIVTQFAYGEAAFPGGAAAAESQLSKHVTDIQSPMNATYPLAVDPEKQILLQTTSAAIDGSTDIVNATIDRPNFGPPAVFRQFALAPGSVPTIVSGWQDVAEAGPLVYPAGVRAYWGEGAT